MLDVSARRRVPGEYLRHKESERSSNFDRGEVERGLREGGEMGEGGGREGFSGQRRRVARNHPCYPHYPGHGWGVFAALVLVRMASIWLFMFWLVDFSS